MGYRKFFGVMLAMVLLSSMAALAPSVFLRVWEGQGKAITLRRIAVLLGVIAGSKALSIGLTVFRERYARNFNERNFRRMLDDTLHMEYDSILSIGPANLLERISGAVNNIYFYMTGDAIGIWASGITVAGCLGLTAAVNPWLGLLLLMIAPVNWFGYKLLNQELAKRSKELQEQTSQGFGEILSYVQQVDYVKQSGNYDWLQQALSPAIDKLYRSMARVNQYAQSVSAGLRGLNDIAQNLILMTLVYGFFQQTTGPYTLMMTTILLPMYFSGLGNIVGAKLNQNGFRVAQAFQKELRERRESGGAMPVSQITRLDFEVETLETPGKTIPFPVAGTLQKGDVAQICGESGCGKSTFVKTLLKFRPVSQIWVDGVPVGELDTRQLRSRVEYLSQNVPIVRGTLRDNLFLNLPRTKEAEERFLRDPLLQSVFATKTLDTEIQEGGGNLSGGEKQKIALARALQSPADVLILDEVCSNIDRETALTIYDCLKRTRAGRITILISHDPLPDGLVNVRLHT